MDALSDIISNLNFVVTLFAAELVICSRLPIRRNWYLGLLLLLAPLSVSLWWYALLPTNSLVLVATRYLVIFLLTLPVVAVIHHGTFWTSLFVGILAYCIQHIAYQTYAILECLANYQFPWYVTPLLQALLCAVLYTGLYFLFIRHLKSGEIFAVNGKLQIILSGIILGITVYISLLGSVYAMRSGDKALFCIVCILTILASALGIFVEISLFTIRKSEMELAILRQLLHAKDRQYDDARQSIDIINVKCHDLKHQISALHGQVDRDELRKIEDAVAIYDTTFRTGNDALDVILTEKGLLCHEKGIRLTCMVDGSVLQDMKPSDIYSLFGNALDNAIESVQNLDEEYRAISLSGAHRGRLSCIQIENYYQGNIEFDGGLPVTQKDYAYHGFGMKSMRMVAESYGGEMVVSVSDDIFHVSLFLPQQLKKAG